MTLLDQFDGIANFNKIEWYVKHAEHVLCELGFAGALSKGQDVCEPLTPVVTSKLQSQ